MDLSILWFLLIAVLWTGYLVLEASTSAWACSFRSSAGTRRTAAS